MFYDIYAEIDGSPIYATVEIDDGKDEDYAFEVIVDMFRATLQIDPV